MLANLFYQRTVQNLSSFCVFKNPRRCILSTPRISLSTQNTSKGRLLKPKSTLLVLKQNSSRFLYWKKTDYYKLDRIPNGYQIVYQAQMRYYVVSAQIMTLLMAAGTVYAFCDLATTIYMEKPLNYDTFVESPLGLAVGASVLLLSLIAIQLVIRRFAMRIYYNENSAKFIMMVPTTLPKQERQFVFRAGEMKYLGESNLAGLRGQYLVNDNRFILHDSYFHIPYYLNVMLGYNKPYEE